MPLPPPTKMEQPKTGKKDFILLPVLYKSWPELKLDFSSLADKTLKGIDGFEEVVKKNDRWENINTPFNLLRRVLEEEEFFSTDHFCDTLLPWLARKALDVEDLFKDSEYKITVSAEGLLLALQFAK